MDGATSRSSRGFDDDEDDDEEVGRIEDSSTRKDLTIKVDGKGSGTDQRPNTPRSKHSATEQRRRSKINDRFQILRNLIPHSDQKRDKASFLLEVIEYIHFLQEKAQKYETSFPGWNQDKTKLMPWVKLYFRSFWKNARSNSQAPGDGLPEPSQTAKNGSAPPYMYTGKYDDNSMPVAPAVLSNAHNPPETEIYKAMETSNCFANADNVESHDQSPWLRISGPADCVASSEMVSGQEELTIDEGTISVSAAYSHGLQATLSRALHNSGVDLSQAIISVQVNLGKRAGKRGPATVTTPNHKEQEGPQSINHCARATGAGSGCEGTAKRQRLDAS